MILPVSGKKKMTIRHDDKSLSDFGEQIAIPFYLEISSRQETGYGGVYGHSLSALHCCHRN